ncbi:MAG: RHS repeat-associated core domain-containing protein, partial [Gammaproteobacteria bacterium]
ITGINPDTHELQGRIASDCHSEFSYTRLTFGASPLALLSSSNMPGQQFLAHPKQIFEGPISVLKTLAIPNKSLQLFKLIEENYPESRGYTCNLIQDHNGYLTAKIKDKQQKIVSLFAEEPYRYLKTDNDHIRFSQSSSNYDDNGNITAIFSPKYTECSLDNEKNKLGRFFSYSDTGELLKITDPDAGISIFLYDQKTTLCAAQLQFSLKNLWGYCLLFDYDMQNRTRAIRYCDFDEIKNLLPAIRATNATQALSTEDIELICENLLNVEFELLSTAGRILTQSMISDDCSELFQRGKLANFSNYSLLSTSENDFNLSYEENYNYVNSSTLKKTTTLESNESDVIIYHADTKKRINKIDYPATNDQTLQIIYNYNSLDQITAISLGQQGLDEKIIANFSYTANGNLENEQHIKTLFSRNFTYNDAGLLQSIDDPYLTEKIYFTEHAYGNDNYYDGRVSATEFTAKWLDNGFSFRSELKAKLIEANKPFRDMTLFKAQEALEHDVEKYLFSLETANYLDKNGKLLKPIDSLLANDIAITVDRPVSDSIVQQNFCQRYGHQYEYTADSQLVAAKYSIGDETNTLKRLTPKLIMEKTGLPITTTTSLWKALNEAVFITENGAFLLSLYNTELDTDLDKYKAYIPNICKLLQYYYCNNQVIALENFQQYFCTWRATAPALINVDKKVAENIWDCLQEKNYLSPTNQVTNRFLSPELLAICEKSGISQSNFPSLIQLFVSNNGKNLGSSPNDVNVFEIDPNGNLEKYYVGSTRNKLQFDSAGNQLQLLTSTNCGKQTINSFVYDTCGNITQARHKNLEKIVYDPILKRPVFVEKTDGTIIQYAYDHKGLRVLKRLRTSDNHIHERHYIYNEQNQVLVERYFEDEILKTETAYIYGPIGLFGFIQNNAYFSVVKDHEGSVRLIIDENKAVVASFDYLPYGQLARHSGQIELLNYRYTGQEWDEDLSLYNFRARLYDPDLGRFYQVD